MKDPKDRRATITRAAEGEGKFIRRSGGKGQYGHVVVKIAPNGWGKGIEVVSEIPGSAIPEEYIQPMTYGIREALAGVVEGHPLDDIVVRVVGGSSHQTDSSEIAFKLAAIFATKDAIKKAE